MKELISLSPSKLNDFARCARCFHDIHVSKVIKPRGIVATITNGMDLILKNYVDQYRGNIPHGLGGQIPGVLLRDAVLMTKWRHWKSTDLKYSDAENNIELSGALDDCLDDRGVYIPLDWKSKGSEPKDDGSQYYQVQMDCYNLMLDAKGYKTRDEAYLCYFWPKQGRSNSESGRITLNVIEVLFSLKVFKLTCSKENAKQMLIKAADCLRGKRPESNIDCDHCAYLIEVEKLNKPKVSKVTKETVKV